MSTNQEQIEAAAADPLNEWFRRIGTTLTNDDYEAGIQAMAAHDAAILAAIHPTVSTVEELDALGDRAVVRSDEGAIFEFNKPHGYWMETGFSWNPSSEDICLPATVLHMGGAA